jgi:WhiB family redox-sensing transcriptional regulator
MTHHPHPWHNLRDALDRVETTPCVACPEVFFPEDYPDKETKTYAVEVARALCSGCPVKNECFAYANEADERWGIWGGTLPAER